MFKRFILMLMVGGSMLVMTACHTVPYTGRTQFLMTSESEEKELGEQAWKELQKQEREDTNPVYVNALKRVGANISKVVDKPDYKWEFKVFKNDTPNAFCLPGGKVGVYSGLFKYAANDAELAAVVGHEIGHAIARHGGERMTQNTIQGVGAEVMKTATSDEKMQMAYGLATNLGAILPYSRKHEYEADYMGLIFMAKAGYDPRAAITFWEKFGKLSQTNALTEFLSTHPGGQNRVSDLEKNLPKAIIMYNEAPVKRGLGTVYR